MSVWLLCERALHSIFYAQVSLIAQKRACICSCSQQWDAYLWAFEGAQGSALASGCSPAPSQVPTRLAATLLMHASSHHLDAFAVQARSIGKENDTLIYRVTYKWRYAYIPEQKQKARLSVSQSNDTNPQHLLT